jgi:hypothetical protein
VAALALETGLSSKAIRKSLGRLVDEKFLVGLNPDAYWLPAFFRANCSSDRFAGKAYKEVIKDWPEIRVKFLEDNNDIEALQKAMKECGSTVVQPQSNDGSTPSASASETETASGPDSGAGAAPKRPRPATGSDSGSGRVDADADRGGFVAPTSGASSTLSITKGNGSTPDDSVKGNPSGNGGLPPQVADILDARFPDGTGRVFAEAKWRAINDGSIKGPDNIERAIQTFREAGLPEYDLAILFPPKAAP